MTIYINLDSRLSHRDLAPSSTRLLDSWWLLSSIA